MASYLLLNSYMALHIRNETVSPVPFEYGDENLFLSVFPQFCEKDRTSLKTQINEQFCNL